MSDLNGDLEPTLASLGLVGAEDEDDVDVPGEGGSLERKKKTIISDALAKGLSVNVNGLAWQRVFIRIDDTADEAVIIIYGLMPGRPYEIDLGLVQGDQTSKIRRQVITEDVDLEPPEVHTDPDSPSFDHSASSDPPVSTPSTSPNRTLPSTPPSTSTPLTMEDRLTQLQHALAVINTERDALTASLKSARRDAQKADAALRSEIDILKRASEKHAAAEHRAKQKILSLQEALKRAQTAARETEELTKEVEGAAPELDKQRTEKEDEYLKIKEEADRARKERHEEGEKEKKRLEVLKGELAALNNKLEKINGKKEKLETSVISDLEEQLKEVETEVDKAETQSHANIYASSTDRVELTMEDLIPNTTDPATDQTQSSPYHSVQRTRHQSANPGPISRPSVSIQRPPSNETSLNHQPQLWNPSPRQSQNHTHNQRSSSLHHQTPTLLVNPQRQSSLKSNTTPPANNTSSSTSLSSSPTLTNAAFLTTSTLSSRAPAFEPGRSLKNPNATAGASSGYSVSPIPIQRPGGASRSMSVANHPKTGTHPQWAGILTRPP